jgi:ubiquinone/menaquinone biosynthesis C-methylase UbiE
MAIVLQPVTRAEEYEYRAKYLKDEHHMSGDGPRSAEFRIDKALRYVPFAPNDVVLDISVGKGLLFERIHEKVKECHGTDVTPAMVKRVSDKFKHHPNVHFTTAFSWQLPYPDAMFDKVLMTGAFCLQETKEECMRSLAEIRRVAKPSALIFISDIAVQDESTIEPERISSVQRLKRRIAQDGAVEFLASAKRFVLQKLRQRLGLEPILVESTRGIWFPHDTFVAMCRENKLDATGFQTQMITGPSATRKDYLMKLVTTVVTYFHTHVVDILEYFNYMEAVS